VEDCSGSDEGDQVWCVESPPAGLCGVDELVGHGNSGGTGARPLVTLVRNLTVANVCRTVSYGQDLTRSTRTTRNVRWVLSPMD
jgi:hypothetical protein